MNSRFTASHGIGEIYVDPFKMTWSKFDSSLFERKKELPLFQFVLDLANKELMRENISTRTLNKMVLTLLMNL